MSDAFVYMFVVASGAASGVAVVAFVCYKIYGWSQGKGNKNTKKRRAIV